ncbi:MAG TPA: L,D-transpeptidase [Phycisphaerae bacterium]|nr:L,D-transpeptidase [Phycisphaerae bacterium]
MKRAWGWIIKLEIVGLVVAGALIAARPGRSGQADARPSEPPSGNIVTAVRAVDEPAPAPADAPPAQPAQARPATPAKAARDWQALRTRSLGELKHPSVVVQKSTGRLLVYDGDELVKWYPVAVGAGKGDKSREGDQCTPVGEFYICVKKTRPETQYVRSMGLSYPNASDARDALRDGRITRAQHDAIVSAIARGEQPPWNTPLGGAIMIHGCRRDAQGNVRPGTQGCVAMEDDDVIELFPHLPVGTPVAIVP